MDFHEILTSILTPVCFLEGGGNLSALWNTEVENNALNRLILAALQSFWAFLLRANLHCERRKTRNFYPLFVSFRVCASRTQIRFNVAKPRLYKPLVPRELKRMVNQAIFSLIVRIQRFPTSLRLQHLHTAASLLTTEGPAECSFILLSPFPPLPPPARLVLEFAPACEMFIFYLPYYSYIFPIG